MIGIGIFDGPELATRPPAMMRSRAPTASVSVLHVFAPGLVGGCEAVVRALTVGSRGSSVEANVAAVVLPGEFDLSFLAPFRDAGVPVFTIQVPHRGYLQERTQVARLCRELGPDVVHTHGYRADVLDAPIARRLGIVVVSTVHGFTGGPGRLYQWLQRRALRRFDAVVAVSRMLRDDLARSGVPRKRLYCVPNAWHPWGPLLDHRAACRALGITPDGFRVGWVGRLSREKGPDVLVDALGQLGDAPVTASFLGAGALRQALDTRARALRVADRISWHGLVPGAGELFRAFGAFVLTSRTEGTPIALLEAMAAGVPIIAANVGGVPDVVSSNEALLVPPENPQAVAAAIREVLENPAAARSRARAARERLEREFGLAAWLERYEAIYRAVCTSSTGPARNDSPAPSPPRPLSEVPCHGL
jgi:glycosyltransferase involved in cell wall biosynthesis